MDNIDATLVLTDYNEVSDINTCKLHLKCIDNENELYYLKFGTNKIGRSPENDICIPNSAFVSTFHAIIDVEGTNDNYLCFISDLKSTNKTKIGASLDPKSLFTLTPQKNYQIKLNDVIILGQYKCTLSFQKNKGGDTPKIKSGGTQKLKDDNIGIIKENKKVEKDDEEDDQDIDDEIEKLLSTKNDNNKNNGEDDLEDILSEHESTHLSAEAENVIITLEKKENVVIKEKKKDIVAISNKESEDTILYSGDCNLEEASPSFFDKLKADDEMKDDDFDSDLDFDEDIFNEEPTVSNKKNNGIPKPNMEDQSRRSPGRKNVEKMDKKDVEDDSSETALSDDSLLEKEIIKEITPKRDLFNMKKIKNNRGSDGSDDDDEKREHTSPFTIPISSASPFTSSPQKKKKDNLVDLDDSASNTLSLTPIKNNSPQPVVETRLFLGEGDTGESATLPMDVPSPSSGSSNPSGKRKNENSGSIGNKGDSSPFSPKKAKPNKKVDPFDEDGTPSHSPLVKFDSPRSKSVSPHKPKKGFSSNNLNGRDNRGSPKPGGIKTKDLSMLFSASGSLDAPTEGDSLVKITQSSNKIRKDKSKEEVVKKSRAERGIDIDEGSHEMTELSEMDDSEGTKNLPQKENSSNEKNKDKKEDFVEEKYTNENNSSNFISSNKQSLFNSFSSKHNDSPGDLSPYQEDYLDDVFGDVVAPNKLEAKGFESDNNIVLSKSANLENNISDNKKKVEKELERKNSKKKTPVSSPIITPKTKKKSASPKPQKKRKNSKKDKEKSPEHDSFLDFISSRKHSDKNDSPYKVMFTGITDKKREEVIKKLGGQIVDNFEKGCSHLITNKIRLTNKFLCGISLTDHIIDIKWVDECKKQGKFVSEEDFVLNDKENEGKWKFSLKESIDKSKYHKKLLAELSIYATPNLLSANSFISEMVHAHGGTFLENPPKSYDKTIIVLSSKEDLQSNEFLSLSRINFKIFSLEFFLISVLKQELLFKNYSPLNL